MTPRTDERLEGLPTGFSESAKRVNDLVRGWRAYYGDLSTQLNEQLSRLDESRRRDDGRLRLSTVMTFERALAANLSRVDRGGRSLEKRIRLQTAAFKRALEDKCRFHAEVMEW